MTRNVVMASALAAASLAAWAAVAQDAPPPGCRWQSAETLACKDGAGHWRRSGDGEIVGTYPMTKPKPKPKPAPAGAQVAAAAGPVVADMLPPPPPPPTPEQEAAAAMPPPAALAAPRTSEPAPAPAPQAAPAAPEPHKSWFQRWLDDIWSDIKALMRLLHIMR